MMMLMPPPPPYFNFELSPSNTAAWTWFLFCAFPSISIYDINFIFIESQKKMRLCYLLLHPLFRWHRKVYMLTNPMDTFRLFTRFWR
jgi:hypothetical protein